MFLWPYKRPMCPMCPIFVFMENKILVPKSIFGYQDNVLKIIKDVEALNRTSHGVSVSHPFQRRDSDGSMGVDSALQSADERLTAMMRVALLFVGAVIVLLGTPGSGLTMYEWSACFGRGMK